MKIAIVTFVKAKNYGAELQAYALHKAIEKLGHDVEVLDLEKEQNVMVSSYRTILTSFKNRIAYFGIFKGLMEFIKLIINQIADKYQDRKKEQQNFVKCKKFNEFFNTRIKHSSNLIRLNNIEKTELHYDLYIAGSDQIWNYMQTRRLDIFFLQFALKYNCKRISYAASFSVPELPKDMISLYRDYLNSLDAISVREISALKIIEDCNNDLKPYLVLDPTFLLSKKEWINNLFIPNYMSKYKKIVLIYTLSGSKYIYRLANEIASILNAVVINIKGDSTRIKDEYNIIHVEDAGPEEFITLFGKASYVITDSFHGTAFSINFNIPFTTLLNPVSNLNSRVLSILELTRLNDRIIYDDGTDKIPEELSIDFEEANMFIADMKKSSYEFLSNSIG